MTTTRFTKEQLIARAREKVKSLEFAVSQTAFAENRAEIEEELELARIALASLEAEPVAFMSKLKSPAAVGSEHWDYTDHRQPDAFELENCVIERLFIVQPAPVSVPDEKVIGTFNAEKNELALLDKNMAVDKFAHWHVHNSLEVIARPCRAAMLQGADGTLTNESTIPVTQIKPVADLYSLTSPTSGETSFTFDTVEARDFIDGGWSCQEYVELERFQEAVSGNSPVIPDGWVMVPVEPTEHMIVEGFESWPYESFSDTEVWEAFQEMSGCQQSAHLAKLCWAAMIAAAPQQEVK